MAKRADSEIRTTTARGRRSLRRYRTPPRRSFADSRPPPVRRMRATSIRNRPKRTARKLAPLMKKAPATPETAISSPAAAGPRTRAAWNAPELRAIAFDRSSFPTSSTTKACRAGGSRRAEGPAPGAPRGAGELVREPVLGDRLHPGAHQGGELAEEPEAEVAVAKPPERRGDRPVPGLGHLLFLAADERP